MGARYVAAFLLDALDHVVSARVMSAAFVICFITQIPLASKSSAYTYTYQGQTLTLSGGPPASCPASVGGITATVIDLGYDRTGSISGGMYSGPITNWQSWNIVNGQVASAWFGGGSGVPPLTSGVRTYSTPSMNYYQDGVDFQLSGSVSCSYKSTAPGIWSSVPAWQAGNGKTLGAVSAPKAPQSPPDNQSSPANPSPTPGCGCPTDSASSEAPDPFEGDPVNASTGNLFEAEDDFTAAPSTGLALTRYYNSQDSTFAGQRANRHHRRKWLSVFDLGLRHKCARHIEPACRRGESDKPRVQ
jgi:hypothetical protein